MFFHLSGDLHLFSLTAIAPHYKFISPIEAREIGIDSIDDLYGGLVTEPFQATKAIMHPLVDSQAQHPPGWSDDFARTRKNEAITGFTVFSKKDAISAIEIFLQE